TTTGLDVDFTFDLIIVDEASQYPTDHFLSCLQFINNDELQFVTEKNAPLEDYSGDLTELINKIKPETPLKSDSLTKVVIVGDNNQLPPVRGIKPPCKLENVLGSLFDYYSKVHNLPTKQLETNYRSHESIVEYTSRLNLYENLKAYKDNAKKTIDGDVKMIKKSWLKEVLDPEKIVSTLIHDSYFDMTVSEFEASMTVELILGYYYMNQPKSRLEQKEFWKTKVGIVAPHNAHGRLIIRRIFEELSNDPKCKLISDELMYELKKAIVSVEKFQGSDRNLIIATMGISDNDQLAAEEEFIYDLNRFNVLTSRAKSKVILLCSRNFLDYMPKRREILNYSSKIRDYALDFCDETKQLPIKDSHNNVRDVEFRFRKTKRKKL
ncbi:MAG: DEAD/DEAH box helicase, partial [Candidatus Heimdallarchaeota archaeon]